MIKKRILWIDLARAAGMLLIIVGHVPNAFSGFTYNMIYAVNVPLFFILSGYLFKPQSYIKQLYKLFCNLIMPYLFTGFLMLLITEFVNHIWKYGGLISGGSTKEMLAKIFFAVGTNTNMLMTGFYMPSIGAIWFLPALFFSSIIYNFLMKTTDKYKYGFYIVGVISLVICCLGFLITKNNATVILPWSLNAAFIGTFFLWIGTAIHKNKFMKHYMAIFSILGLIIWAFASRFGAFWLNRAYADNPIIAIIGACGGSYAIMSICYAIEKFTDSNTWHKVIKLIAIYGKDSLIVLCAHIIDLNHTLSSVYIIREFSNIPTVGNTLLILYRIAITVIAIVLFRFLPIFKNIYYNRQYPFNFQKNILVNINRREKK